MVTVEKIQSEIESLSYPEYKQILRWINEKDWQDWDEEIENDVASGKLDFLIEEALAEKKMAL